MQIKPAIAGRLGAAPIILRTMLGKIVLAGLANIVLALPVAAPALAGYPAAPDVVVFCEPTLRHAVADVGELWRQQTGVAVRVFTSPTWALLEQVAHRVRDDVLIGESNAASAAAVRRELIEPRSLQPLGANRLVVAALAANIEKTSAAPPFATGRLSSLAGQATIAIVDPWAATAGADSEKALQSLGLWQAVHSKSIGVDDTADASFLVAEGRVPLAIVYATDVAADPDFAVADRLPAASYPPIVYWVAVTERALSPNAAKFVAFLHDPQARQRLRSAGLEVSP
jgi:molybdate transport system substrate-binding protein